MNTVANEPNHRKGLGIIFSTRPKRSCPSAAEFFWSVSFSLAVFFRGKIGLGPNWYEPTSPAAKIRESSRFEIGGDNPCCRHLSDQSSPESM